MAIRLGLGLPQLRQYDLAKDVTDVARAAERTGYDSVWVYERLLVPESPTQGLYGVPGLPWPDWYRGMAHPLVTLTLAAAVTERVRLGTGVVVAPLHGPVQLAKALATLDAASGGRVVAGLGTGWSTDEFAAALKEAQQLKGVRLLHCVSDIERLNAAGTTVASLREGRRPAI